jgi:tRNA(Arg) A34 adenosine deaminase TadA
MNQAIRAARRGIAAGQLPFGAAVVRNGRVIACRYNTVAADKDPTAHAEVVCIRAACRKLRRRDLSDCEIYSTCEPCAMCAGACYAARAAAIYFGAYIADKQVCGLPDLGVGAAAISQLSPHAPRTVGGVCRKQCVDLFRLYAEAARRVAAPTAKKRGKNR